MPFDTAILDGDFVPMDHKTIQPIPAKALRCFDEQGTEISGYRHLVNGATGKTIRVIPDTYTLVQNEDAIAEIETALVKSKLDLTDARFGADYSNDGARGFFQWIFPAHTAKVKGDVEASLRVVLLNSYDGSSSLFGRVGSFNWACANTALCGAEWASFKFRHKGKIDLVPAIAKLTLAAEKHVEQAEQWERWPSIDVSDQIARATLATLPGASQAQVDALIHAWLKARDEDPVQGGPNLWCLFNVLTAWASQKDAGVENRPTRNFERQERVAELVEGKLWQELAAA